MLQKKSLLTIILIGAILSIGAGVIIPNSIAESQEMKQVSSLKDNQTPKYYYDSETGIYKVKAGGGGGRIVVMNYYPQNLEIKVGDTVQFYNPSTVLEPHTVSFITDTNYVPQFAGPYSIKDPESVQAFPNEMNSEPLVVPVDEDASAILAINARGFFPYVVDSSGNPQNLGPNASITIDGSEKYVNSGWLLPKVYLNEIPGSSETFSVTFAKSGNYPYICILHPWMSGQVQVTE